MSNLQNAIYHDDHAAREYLEALRWPDGPVCPHCGSIGNATLLKGKSTRPGVHKCKGCRKPFSVTIGTLFERSHIPLSKWLMGFYLMASSKKGISAHQLHRTLDITYKSAWFMEHRIREAMRDGSTGPLGGGGKIVEADETYYGPKKEKATKTTSGRNFTGGGRGVSNKRVIVSLVERGGKVKSFHVERADKETVARIVTQNVAKESTLHTDESRLYHGAGGHVTEHHTVHHAAGEYVRGTVHTNTIENYFSVFKRGMRGVYQHCDEKHLHRYLAEFDFRHNNRNITDGERSVVALKGIEGRRLTYRRVSDSKKNINVL